MCECEGVCMSMCVCVCVSVRVCVCVCVCESVCDTYRLAHEEARGLCPVSSSITVPLLPETESLTEPGALPQQEWVASEALDPPVSPLSHLPSPKRNKWEPEGTPPRRKTSSVMSFYI